MSILIEGAVILDIQDTLELVLKHLEDTDAKDIQLYKYVQENINELIEVTA